MFATKSFNFARSRLLLLLSLAFGIGLVESSWSQAVPSQANIDASAQRRLQETMREAQRQRRIEENLRHVQPALSTEKLAGPRGPVLARQAMAALIRLRGDGLALDDSLRRAIRSAGIDAAAAARPSAYLQKLVLDYSHKITPSVLSRLEAGEDPAPNLVLPPFSP